MHDTVVSEVGWTLRFFYPPELSRGCPEERGEALRRIFSSLGGGQTPATLQ